MHPILPRKTEDVHDGTGRTSEALGFSIDYAQKSICADTGAEEEWGGRPLNDDFAASEGIVAGLAVAGVRVLGQPYPLAVGLQGAPAPGEDVAQRLDGEAVGLVDGVELVFAALTPPGQHDQQERHSPRAHGVRV